MPVVQVRRNVARLFLVAGILGTLATEPAVTAWPRAPHARRHQTLISTLTATQITISEDSGPRTFAITPFTEVIVNDQRATLTDLHPGMRVSVTLDDPVRLRQIKAWSTR